MRTYGVPVAGSGTREIVIPRELDAAHTRDAPRWMSGSTQVITAGLLLTAAVVFAQTASQLIDFHFFDLRLRVLDSDHHASVFGAISILAASGCCGGDRDACRLKAAASLGFSPLCWSAC